MPYCTKTDVEAVWNPAAVLASADDDNSGALDATELGHITRAIDRAGGELDALLGLRYDLSQLVGNAWCRDAAAEIAAYLLAIRKLDPPPAPLRERYLARLSDLQEIAHARREVPHAPPLASAGELPTVSNFTLTPQPRPR